MWCRSKPQRAEGRPQRGLPRLCSCKGAMRALAKRGHLQGSACGRWAGARFAPPSRSAARSLGARCRRRSASGQGCAKARAGGKKSLKPGFRNTHGSRLADVSQLSLSTSPAFYTPEARKREGKDRQKRQERSRFPYRISELFVYSYRA